MPQLADDPVGYWNDEAGPRWVRVQPAIDRLLAPVTERLLRDANACAGEQVLDVGCGSGTLTLATADRVGPTGRVLGVDLSQPLLDHARSRCSGIGHIELTHGDAATFSFESARMDLVTSRFGVMFFPDPVQAFSNLGNALRKTGRLVVAAWRSVDLNPWMTFLMRAFPEIEPSPPPPEDKPGPFSLSSPDRIRSILERAAFSDIRLESFDTSLELGATVDQALHAFTEVGPLSRVLAETPDRERPALVDRARSFLDEQYRAGVPSLDAAAWIVHATR